MTEYLHEKTALLPRIKIREVKAIIGKNTEQAMLIGAVHGYRGLIRGIDCGIEKDFARQTSARRGHRRLRPAHRRQACPKSPPSDPLLTLEGLRSSGKRTTPRLAGSPALQTFSLLER